MPQIREHPWFTQPPAPALSVAAARLAVEQHRLEQYLEARSIDKVGSRRDRVSNRRSSRPVVEWTPGSERQKQVAAVRETETNTPNRRETTRGSVALPMHRAVRAACDA